MPGPSAGGGGEQGRGGGGAHPRSSVGGGADIVSGGGNGNTRTKLKPLEMRDNLGERLNTLVIEGKGLSVLPSEGDLVHFMDKVVFTIEETKQFFAQIKSIYVNENKRKYLIQMEKNENMTVLAGLSTNGLAWPGYTDEDGNDCPRLFYGKSVVWAGGPPRTQVRNAVSALEQRKEIKQGKLDKYGIPACIHITTDKWYISIVKKREVKIPGVVLQLGSERIEE